MIKRFENKIGYKKSFDIVKREFDNYIIYYASSLASSSLIQEIISGRAFSNKIIFNKDIKEESDLNNLCNSLYFGNTILFLNNKSYILETREYPTRSISEPSTEKSIRGGKDGFNESIITNVGLIRRRVKKDDLRFYLVSVGKDSKCDVCLCYLENRVNKRHLKQIKNKLNQLKVDHLVMSDRALEENLFKQKYIYYPLVKYTERADLASIHILKGFICIIVDTSASVILTPTTFFEQMKHVEEYRQIPLVGTLLRLVRYVAIFLSLFLIPFWYFIISKNDVSLTVPVFYQLLIAEIMIEILRIATIHTPSELSSAIGIVAAILLGQMAIDLNIFTSEILLVVSISTIGSFATPSYELSLSNKLTSIIILILVFLFNEIGLIVGFFAFFLYLASISVLDTPYLYPLIPFDLEMFKNLFIRKSNNK